MKKINALFFAMALVAIVAFASTAGAATKLLGVDNGGYVKIITIDKESSSPIVIADAKVEASDAVILEGDLYTKLTENTRFFPYGEQKIAAVASDDKTRVYLFDVSDGIKLEKIVENSGLGADTVQAGATGATETIEAVLTFNGNPVFITAGKLGTLKDSKIEMFNASVDVACVYDSRFFIIGVASSDVDGYKGITADVGETAENTLNAGASSNLVSGEVFRELVSIVDYDAFHGKVDTAKVVALTGDYAGKLSGDQFLLPSVVLGDNLYIAHADGLLLMDLQSQKTGDGMSLGKAEFSAISDTKYKALFKKDDNTAYAFGNEYPAVLTLSDEELKVKTGSKTIGDSLKDSSFDVLGNDEVLVVVAHGKGIAIYNAETLELVGNPVTSIRSAAMISSTDDDKKTDDDEKEAIQNVDTSKVAALDAIKQVTGAESFETATFADASNADTDAVNEAISKDIGGNGAKVAKAIKNVTLTNAGYVLLEGTEIDNYKDASKYAFYFVGSSMLAATTDEVTRATTLSSTGTEVKDSGTIAYVAGGKLDAGTYTLVAAEKQTSNTPPKNAGSSGGGCNAGFGLLSIAALAAAFKKLSERR